MVKSRIFCCCIPVRAGVVILSMLGLLGGAGIAAIGIINLRRNAGSRVANILQTVVYILLSLLSITGLIGAIGRKLVLVRTFFAMILAHLLFAVGTGIYAIFLNFKDAPRYVRDCIGGSIDGNVIKTCQNGATLVRVMAVVLFLFAWILEIWAAVIVNSYGKQLAEERENTIVKNTETW